MSSMANSNVSASGLVNDYVVGRGELLTFRLERILCRSRAS